MLGCCKLGWIASVVLCWCMLELTHFMNSLPEINGGMD
jgi:hypothetical protein